MGTVLVAALLCATASPRARLVDDAEPLEVRALASEIDQFLLREVTAHLAAIPTLDPPPDRVLNARTVGEFSWGTFMRALAAEAQHAGVAILAGRDVPDWIGRMGLIEARAGGKAFSQMYAALALQHFGENLDRNAVWQKLTAGERDEWRSLLDVKRFYDLVNRRVIDLAENYLGVAARVGAIVSQYARAWNFLRHDFKDSTHLLSLFDFGRGNFAYINIDREWQQTTGFFGKAVVAHGALVSVLEREKQTRYPARPSLTPVARFQFFREKGERVAGVWVVRQSPTLRFALPITTGTRPGVADYLPAPHGLPGFAVPVEQDLPALVPYLELADGRAIVAADGADEIHPSADGRELRAVWRRWAQPGTKSGQLVDAGVTSEVRWTLGADRIQLTRSETLTARAPATIRRWRLVVPSTATTTEETADGVLLSGASAPLRVNVTTPWPLLARRARHARRAGDVADDVAARNLTIANCT